MKVGNRIVQDVMLLNNKKMVRYFESLIIGSLFVYCYEAFYLMP